MNYAPIYMIIATLFFVCAHSSVKALADLPLNQVIFVRLITSIIFCLMYFGYKKTHPLKGIHGTLIWRGVFGVLGMGFFFYTLRNMPLATAISINYLAPMFALIFAIPVMKEVPKPYIWPLLVLAFVGVLSAKGFDARVQWLDVGASLCAAMLAGMAYTLVRKAGLRSGPMAVVFILPLVGVLPVGALFLFNPPVMPNTQEWILLGVMSVCVFLAQVFMTLAYVGDQVSNVTLPRYLTIVWSALAGVLIFEESFSLGNALGIGCIVSALLLNEFLRRRHKARIRPV